MEAPAPGLSDPPGEEFAVLSIKGQGDLTEKASPGCQWSGGKWGRGRQVSAPGLEKLRSALRAVSVGPDLQYPRLLRADLAVEELPPR